MSEEIVKYDSKNWSLHNLPMIERLNDVRKMQFMDDYVQKFKKIGKLVWQQGLISYLSGNLSILVNDRKDMLITKTHASLADLSDSDIIYVSDFMTAIPGLLVSSEFAIHKEIYSLALHCNAIVHTHSPNTMIWMDGTTGDCSFDNENFDREGRYYLKGRIDYVDKSKEKLFRENRRVLIERRHGIFGFGESLEEAFSYVSTLEHSCKIVIGINRNRQPYRVTVDEKW